MLTSHYAIMHAQEESIKRVLPMPVVVYHMYLKLVHSGETAESVLAMADPEFGTFVSQGWQITCDPGLVPYERDAGLGASIGPHLFDNTLVNTENIVSRPSLSPSVFASERNSCSCLIARLASAP